MVRTCGLNVPAFTLALVSAEILSPRPLAAQQQTINACLTPAGQVRIVAAGEVCRPQEALVAWSTGGASVPTVVDATGARVGVYMGGSTLVTIGDDRFIAQVGRLGFTDAPFASFAYLTPDCTGQRYSYMTSDSLVPFAPIISRTAMVEDRELPAVTINGDPMNPGTYWVFSSNMPAMPPMCFQVSPPVTQVLVPLKSVDVSQFVPPFRIR